ncbi:hypothetical protein OAX78_01175 [Planctomycetota bacterium]|nr:hypothetical protein [Planctomycetota bacterium]
MILSDDEVRNTLNAIFHVGSPEPVPHTLTLWYSGGLGAVDFHLLWPAGPADGPRLATPGDFVEGACSPGVTMMPGRISLARASVRAGRVDAARLEFTGIAAVDGEAFPSEWVLDYATLLN